MARHQRPRLLVRESLGVVYRVQAGDAVTLLSRLKTLLTRWRLKRDRALIRTLQRRTLVRYVDEDRRWKRFTQQRF